MINNDIFIEQKIQRLKDIIAELEETLPSSEEAMALLDQACSCIEELLNELQDV